MNKEIIDLLKRLVSEESARIQNERRRASGYSSVLAVKSDRIQEAMKELTSLESSLKDSANLINLLRTRQDTVFFNGIKEKLERADSLIEGIRRLEIMEFENKLNYQTSIRNSISNYQHPKK